MNRLRPRFSLRTLAIFIALVAAYFSAQEATKHWCLSRSEKPGVQTNVPMPFVIADEFRSSGESHSGAITNILFLIGRHEPIEVRRQYSLWFFGLTMKLPFESKWYEVSE